MTSSGRATCPCHCPRSQDGDLYGAWCPFPLSPSLDSWFRTPQVRLDSPQASGDGARAVRGRSRSVEWLRPAVLDARHTAVPPAGGSCPALRPDPGRCVRDLLEASGLSPGLALSDRPAPACRPSPGQPGLWLVESVHGVPRRHWGGPSCSREAGPVGSGVRSSPPYPLPDSVRSPCRSPADGHRDGRRGRGRIRRSSRASRPRLRVSWGEGPHTTAAAPPPP